MVLGTQTQREGLGESEVRHAFTMQRARERGRSYVTQLDGHDEVHLHRVISTSYLNTSTTSQDGRRGTSPKVTEWSV